MKFTFNEIIFLMKNNNEGFFTQFSDFFSNLFESSSTTSLKKSNNYPTSFYEIMDSKGYEYEEFTITTQDNYHIKLFHILNNKNKLKNNRINQKYPVLFIHGILDSSDSWVSNNSNSSLPLVLDELNFDIWLLNCRGNRYSISLETPETTSPNSSYWSYSFQEIGLYDIPATMDFIYRKNEKKMFLICHSQGCCSVIAGMCQINDVYQEKTCGIILLAPPSRVDHTDCSKIINILTKVNFWEILKERKSKEIFKYDQTFSSLNSKMNNIYPIGYMAVLEMVSDNSLSSITQESLGAFLSIYPSGTSIQSMMHFKQLYDAKEFQQYDYGKEENVNRYGSEEPPKYNFENINGLNIIVCGGVDDALVNIEDVRWVKHQLKKRNVLYGYHECEFMGHLSFLINNNIIWFNPVLREIYKLIEVNENLNK